MSVRNPPWQMTFRREADPQISHEEVGKSGLIEWRLEGDYKRANAGSGFVIIGRCIHGYE